MRLKMTQNPDKRASVEDLRSSQRMEIERVRTSSIRCVGVNTKGIRQNKHVSNVEMIIIFEIRIECPYQNSKMGGNDLGRKFAGSF